VWRVCVCVRVARVCSVAVGQSRVRQVAGCVCVGEGRCGVGCGGVARVVWGQGGGGVCVVVGKGNVVWCVGGGKVACVTNVETTTHTRRNTPKWREYAYSDELLDKEAVNVASTS